MARKKIIIGMGLGLAVAAGLGFAWRWSQGQPGMNLHGIVEVQEVRLSSKVGGRVKTLYVKEGDLVEPGQRLLELDAPELEAQRLQLVARVQAASARRDKAVRGNRPEEKRAAKAAMQAAEANWQKMKKGYRTEEVEQARAELASAAAEHDHALKNYQRERQLYPQASARADYEASAAALARLEGKLNAARARLHMLTEGYRGEDIAQAQAEFERAQANWQLLEAGTRAEDIAEAEAQVAELKAKLQEIETMLREAVVTAPERAVVEVLAVRPGDVVAANQPVARVLRAGDLWVKAFVPEVNLGQVHLHQKVEVTCDAYPGKRFQGEVIYIASASEFTPRNVQSYDERRHQVFAIKIHVADPQGVFKSGMAAEVWLLLAE